MNTKELRNIPTYYHLQEFSSGAELIQALQEDNYAREFIAPAGGIIVHYSFALMKRDKKLSFYSI
jgi:hypothetical protein